MQTKDIADLFIEATSRVELYWDFYTVALVALIGWLVSTKKALHCNLKLLITVGYTVFALMNILGLWGSYSFAEALRQDLLIAANKEPDALVQARAILSQRSFAVQKYVALVIHVVMGIVVVVVVWLGRTGGQHDGVSD